MCCFIRHVLQILKLLPEMSWKTNAYVNLFLCCKTFYLQCNGSCRGRNRLVVGFTTTCAVDVFPHWCWLCESRSGRGVQHYVICIVFMVLWSLTPLSTIFQLYRGCQFYWWRKNHRPAGSHWQALSHNVVHLVLSGIRTINISGERHRLHR
jgi:hypothetical protein